MEWIKKRFYIFIHSSHSPGVSGVLCSDNQGLCLGGKIVRSGIRSGFFNISLLDMDFDN